VGREPLRGGLVTIILVAGSISLPADFILISAWNLC
jgi:predicted ATPase with chaperone activity